MIYIFAAIGIPIAFLTYSICVMGSRCSRAEEMAEACQGECE
jgi:hypothetical protein